MDRVKIVFDKPVFVTFDGSDPSPTNGHRIEGEFWWSLESVRAAKVCHCNPKDGPATGYFEALRDAPPKSS